MKLISVVQRKGGAGKTTLAVNVAGELANRGHTVALIDADPQASAYTWSRPRRLGFSVRASIPVGWKAIAWIKGIYKSNTDFVLIDTPPELGDTFKLCVELSDLLLIPCGPSSLDINATGQTLTRIRELCRGGVEPPEALVVPTRVDVSTPEGQQLAGELSGYGFGVSNVVSFDMSYVRAYAMGQSVADFAPRSDADDEIRLLVDMALARLKWNENAAER